MDFQEARHLTALDRALRTLEKTLLHLGDCEDCLNREVILPGNASDKVGQVLDLARVSLLRIQATLHQSHQEALSGMQYYHHHRLLAFTSSAWFHTVSDDVRALVAMQSVLAYLF